VGDNSLRLLSETSSLVVEISVTVDSEADKSDSQSLKSEVKEVEARDLSLLGVLVVLGRNANICDLTLEMEFFI